MVPANFKRLLASWKYRNFRGQDRLSDGTVLPLEPFFLILARASYARVKKTPVPAGHLYRHSIPLASAATRLLWEIRVFSKFEIVSANTLFLLEIGRAHV